MIRERVDVERIFLTASRLRGKSRQRYLDDECGQDEELRTAVDSLLGQVDSAERQPPSDPVLFQAGPSPRRAALHRRGLRWIERLTSLVFSRVGLITALGIITVTVYLVQRHIREGIADALERVLIQKLDQTEGLVSLWSELLGHAASTSARDREIRPLLLSLLDPSSSAQERRDEADDTTLQLGEHLDALRGITAYEGFSVIDPSGRVVASSDGQRTGTSLSFRGAALLAPIFDEEAVVVELPVDEAEVFQAARGEAVSLAAAPILDDQGGVLGALVLRFGQRGFFRRLGVSTVDPVSLDSFAYTDRGELISGTIWLEALREAGVVGEGQSPEFLVKLGDPGRDLRGRKRGAPAAPAATAAAEEVSWSRTVMSESATRRETGMDLEGYPNFAGIEVIGAWRWLPDHGFGVASEIELSEAWRLVRPLYLGFVALLTLFLSAILVSFTYSYAFKELRKRERSRRLGQYTLLQKLGEGGMGAVYLARHSMLRRETAVKILRSDVMTPENIVRFEREVQLTSQLNHPATIEIFDYGHDPSGVFYYVMEFIDGWTLARLLEEDGAQPQERVVHILRQVCGSLNEAHRIGLIHRDIKPPNLMLCQRGGVDDVVKLLDFGLVKDVQVEDTNVTRENVVSGTPLYIAPERVLAPDTVDARTDIYSLGSVAYALLTGRELFTGKSPSELLDKSLHEDPAPIAGAGIEVDPGLEKLILSCLAKKPEHRPASAAEVLRTLDALALAPWRPEQAHEWWDRRAPGQRSSTV